MQQLERRLVCYNGDTRGEVLVEATDINVVLRLGEISALSFKLPGLYNIGTDAGYVNLNRNLLDNWDVALEVGWGDTWYEPLNARFEITKEEREDDLYGAVNVSGVGVVSDLAYGVNLSTTRIGKDTGTHDYSQVTGAQVLWDWLVSAQGQGSLSRLKFKRSGTFSDPTLGWSASADSRGEPWTTNARTDANIQRTASCMDVLRSLEGTFQWVTKGNTLALFESGHLDSLRTKPVELVLGRDLQNIPLRRDISERVQRVVAFGEKGVNKAASNGTTGGTRGPRTRAVALSGEKVLARLTARAEAEVSARQQVREELRRDLDLENAAFLPWRDFELGSVVESEGWTMERESYKVSEIVLRDGGQGQGLQVAVTLGDPSKSALQTIQQRVVSLAPMIGDPLVVGAKGGATGGGGTIRDPRADEGPPAAPTVAGFSISHTISPSGFTVAAATVTWNPVTLAASGDPLWRDILEYKIEGRDGRNPNNPWVNWGTSAGGVNSFTKDGLFPAQSYWVRVAARTEEGWSAYSAEVEMHTGQDSTPPPIPLPPNLTTSNGIVHVEVTGGFMDGAARPADFSHFEVWVSLAGATHALNTTVTGRGSIPTQAASGTAVDAYLIAVDTSGNKSAKGASASITAKGVLDDPAIVQRFTDVDTEFDQVWTEAQEGLVEADRLRQPVGAFDTAFITTLVGDTGFLNNLRVQGVIRVGDSTNKVPGTLIEEGSITTAHITTSGINADVVKSGSFSGQLFTGGTFEGSVFRTGTTGPRVWMNSSGIYANNGTSNTFSLTGSTGTIEGFSINGATITGGIVRTASSGPRVQMTGDTMQVINSSGRQQVALVPAYQPPGALDPRSAIVLSADVAGSPARVALYDLGLHFNNGSLNVGSLTKSPGKAMVLEQSEAGQRMNIYNHGAGGSIYMDAAGTASSGGIYQTSTWQQFTIQGTNPGFESWVIRPISLGGINRATLQFSAGGDNMPQTTLAANLFIDSNGYFYRGTASSRRLKSDIRDISTDPTSILEVRVRDWLDKAALSGGLQEGLYRIPGVIAEELEELGLEQFVTYDEDGQTSGVMYDRLPLLLIPVVRQLTQTIGELEARVSTLEGSHG